MHDENYIKNALRKAGRRHAMKHCRTSLWNKGTI